jgi:S1-C subfamily serine protease
MTVKKGILALLTVLLFWSGLSAQEKDSKVAFLGIIVKDTDRGVLIDSVQEDTPAHKAGLMVGDIMIGWNEHTIYDASDFLLNLYTQHPGEKVTITIKREKKVKRFEITLTEKNDRYAAIYNEIPLIVNLFRLEIMGYALDEIGIMVGNIPSTLNEYFEVPDGGVLVQIVEPESEGGRKGIKNGDVIYSINGKPTPYTVQFRQIIDEEKEFDIKLKRKGKEMTFHLKKMEPAQ